MGMTRAEISNQAEKLIADMLNLLQTEADKQAAIRLRDRITEELQTEMQAKATKEFQSQIPSETDLECYRKEALNIEIDALARYSIASSAHESITRHKARWDLCTSVVFFGLLIIAAPLLTVLGIWLGWVPIVHGTVVSMIVLGLISGISKYTVSEKLAEKANDFQGIAAAYTQVADSARNNRIMFPSICVRRMDLSNKVHDMIRYKSDLDRKFVPTLQVLETAKILAQNQLLSDSDAKLFLSQST